jgi:hypothetical protein
MALATSSGTAFAIASTAEDGIRKWSSRGRTDADETGLSTTVSSGQWNISPKFSMPSLARVAFLQNETESEENLANKVH